MFSTESHIPNISRKRKRKKKLIPSMCFKLQINSISKVTCGNSVATLFMKIKKSHAGAKLNKNSIFIDIICRCVDCLFGPFLNCTQGQKFINMNLYLSHFPKAQKKITETFLCVKYKLKGSKRKDVFVSTRILMYAKPWT